MESAHLRWLRRPEGLAVAASILFLAAGVTAAMNALFAAACFAALAIAVSMLVWLAARMQRAEYEAALERVRAAEMRALSIASHDLRQPLHAVTLYLAALDKRVESEEARAILARIESAAQSMSALLSSLTEYARLRAGHRPPALERLPLAPLLARVFGARAPATDAAIHADENFVEEALRQLLDNAERHGGGLSAVHVGAEPGLVRIAIADQGPGIAAADHARIFEPFERLDQSARVGLGLGLALARELARACGGDVALQSAAGGGATFTLTLPSAT